MSENVKQVIVMRTQYPDGNGGTTGLRKGKLIAQGAHAAMAFISIRLGELFDGRRSVEECTAYGDFDLQKFLRLGKVQLAWFEGSFAKVCCQVETEEQLLELYEQAKAADLEVHMIKDSGRTEFHGVPTTTCLAIGPDVAGKIDEITGHLKLL